MANDQAADYDLGRRIAAAREYRAMTQAELAGRLGVGPDTLGRYEQGRFARRPTREGLIAGTAVATDLPREFFVIDFQALPALAERWEQGGDGGEAGEPPGEPRGGRGPRPDLG